jgi:hypothetical protein
VTGMSDKWQINLFPLCPVCGEVRVVREPPEPCKECDKLLAFLARLHGEEYVTAKSRKQHERRKRLRR